ncbi:MAG TPA: lipase family protein [Pyrinomonadaceae bacterium]|nr:lipase family protein [Pyrinomonadaceae bacterium]
MRNKLLSVGFVIVFLSVGSVSAQLTSHFQTWLNANGYSSYNFNASGNSYGGKANSSDTVVNQPVIFIHGNSDSALGQSSLLTGWNSSINYFASQGYKTSEMYAMTWGDANPLQSGNQYHSLPNLQKIRAFIQAVKTYTGATKVDVVTHSMGVTLTRKAILGGSGNDLLNGGNYNLGSPLTSSVDTFVGIAGANRGLVSCYQTGGTTPTCANTNGLYPGYLYFGFVVGVSNILTNMNASSHYEGAYTYSIWSTVDEVIGYGNVVYGQYTSQIPAQNGEKRFTAYPYGHINSKDLTGYNQWRMVKFHAIN